MTARATGALTTSRFRVRVLLLVVALHRGICCSRVAFIRPTPAPWSLVRHCRRFVRPAPTLPPLGRAPERPPPTERIPLPPAPTTFLTTTWSMEVSELLRPSFWTRSLRSEEHTSE